MSLSQYFKVSLTVSPNTMRRSTIKLPGHHVQMSTTIPCSIHAVGKTAKNAYFRPINYISETVEDRHIVTMEDEQEVARAFD